MSAQPSTFTPYNSVSDLAAALNAIIIESGFDDATRTGLMAALDVAAGRNLHFQAKDDWFGRRMPRQRGVSVEHEIEVSERAYAKRWKTAWTLIDAEQTRTGHRFIERRRGGLRGESRDRMRKYPSIYIVPLVEIAAKVVARARSYGAHRGKRREEMFRYAAREVLNEYPQDYRPEGKVIPTDRKSTAQTESESQTDGTVTRILKAQAKLAKRLALYATSTEQRDTLRRALHEAIEIEFADATSESESLSYMTHDAACTTKEDGSVLHAGFDDETSLTEPEFAPFEPSDADAPEWFSDTQNAAANSTPPDVTDLHADAKKTSKTLAKTPSPLHASVHLKDAENEPDLIAQALLYASHGWRVFPLHTPDGAGGCSCRQADCTSVGKHPRTRNGLKDATTDKAQIRKWWRMFPDANIGIATGKDSNLIVIDVDPRHGGWEGLQSLFERADATFPATIEAITGSDGRHFYFQMPDADIRNSANKLAQGVDVRANGGYVVGAPSLHASGKRYAWTQTEAVLEPLPYPFMRQLIEPERKTAREVRVSYSPSQTWQGGTIPDGSRNETMFRKVACAARARGADYNGILDELVRANFQCSPPLSERELNNIANSAAQYPTSRNIYTGSASI